ncbi:MAG TPA: sigma factor-like helix-turn-helix DNA-binding protein [Pseudonocardia sp.]|jgi:DNA-directed RNA polymerase specialized sigma24 family protein
MSQGSSPGAIDLSHSDRGGHRAEFERLCRQNYPRLTAQLHALTNDPALARRLAGAAFGQAQRNWRTVRAVQEPTAWVRARAMHRLTRSMPRRHEPVQPDSSLDPGSRRLLDELGRLPIVQRRALVLAYMARLPIEQLAAEEGTSIPAAELLLSHARLALTHRLAGDDPGIGRTDRWSPDRRYDWLTRRLAVLENRLAPLGETQAVLLALHGGQRRRRTAITVAAGAVLLGAAGTTAALALAHGGHHPAADQPHQPTPQPPSVPDAPTAPAVPTPTSRPGPSLLTPTGHGSAPATGAPGLTLYDDTDDTDEPSGESSDGDEPSERPHRYHPEHESSHQSRSHRHRDERHSRDEHDDEEHDHDGPERGYQPFRWHPDDQARPRWPDPGQPHWRARSWRN